MSFLSRFKNNIQYILRHCKKSFVLTQIIIGSFMIILCLGLLIVTYINNSSIKNINQKIHAQEKIHETWQKKAYSYRDYIKLMEKYKISKKKYNPIDSKIIQQHFSLSLLSFLKKHNITHIKIEQKTTETLLNKNHEVYQKYISNTNNINIYASKWSIEFIATKESVVFQIFNDLFIHIDRICWIDNLTLEKIVQERDKKENIKVTCFLIVVYV